MFTSARAWANEAGKKQTDADADADHHKAPAEAPAQLQHDASGPAGKTWTLLGELINALNAQRARSRSRAGNPSLPSAAQQPQAGSSCVRGMQAQQQQQQAQPQPTQLPRKAPPAWTGALPLLPPANVHRKTLVLDLDHTLIDCLLLRDKHAYEPDFTYTDCEGGRAKVWLRPALLEFLHAVRRDFEVVLFTAAGQRHADAVLGAIDPHRELVEHRLYSVHTVAHPQWSWVKDLSRLGRDLSQVLLVDDCAYAALAQPENWLSIKPYDHAAPRARCDTALLDLLRFLREKVLPAADVRVAVAQYYNVPACRPRKRPAHPHLAAPFPLLGLQLPSQQQPQRRAQAAAARTGPLLQQPAAAASGYLGYGPTNAGAGVHAPRQAADDLGSDCSDCEGLPDGEPLEGGPWLGEADMAGSHYASCRSSAAGVVTQQQQGRRSGGGGVCGRAVAQSSDLLLPLIGWHDWLALVTGMAVPPHLLHCIHQLQQQQQATIAAAAAPAPPQALPLQQARDKREEAPAPEVVACDGLAGLPLEPASNGSLHSSGSSCTLELLIQAPRGVVKAGLEEAPAGLAPLADPPLHRVPSSGPGGLRGPRGAPGACRTGCGADDAGGSGSSGDEAQPVLVLSSSLPGVLTPSMPPPGVLTLDSLPPPSTPGSASGGKCAAAPGMPRPGSARSSGGGSALTRRISSDGMYSGSSGGGACPGGGAAAAGQKKLPAAAAPCKMPLGGAAPPRLQVCVSQQPAQQQQQQSTPPAMPATPTTAGEGAGSSPAAPPAPQELLVRPPPAATSPCDGAAEPLSQLLKGGAMSLRTVTGGSLGEGGTPPATPATPAQCAPVVELGN